MTYDCDGDGDVDGDGDGGGDGDGDGECDSSGDGDGERDSSGDADGECDSGGGWDGDIRDSDGEEAVVEDGRRCMSVYCISSLCNLLIKKQRRGFLNGFESVVDMRFVGDGSTHTESEKHTIVDLRMNDEDGAITIQFLDHSKLEMVVSLKIMFRRKLSGDVGRW